MATEEFKKWKRRFDSSGRIDPVELGHTADQLAAVIGDPDDSNIHETILKYENLEFHFNSTAENTLHLIYEDTNEGVVVTSIQKRS